MPLRWSVALLMVLLAGCSTTRVVRLDTGRGEPFVHIPLTDEAEPVELDDDEFEETLEGLARTVRPSPRPYQAALRLFKVDARSGSYRYEPQSQRLISTDEDALVSEEPQADVGLTHQYLLWCKRTDRRGDCLRLLVDSPALTGDDRYALAMAIAQGSVLAEMREAFEDMADPQAMLASAVWTMTVYMLLWTVPEPFSKGLAAVVTASFICYIGVDTFWTLISGWRRMVEEVDHATSFAEIRAAGERYGKVMGQNAARAFALLLTAAIGQTASSFSAKVPTLPGSAQASVVGAAQAGIRLRHVAHVEAVAVSANAVTMTLSPNSVTSAAKGLSGAAAAPVEETGQRHHIATNKWPDATHSGGPWTPKFQRIFDRAGMTLDDPANQVHVKAHKGPHPQEYHERIYERLDEATKGCSSIQQCRKALTAELQRLAKQITSEGTTLNKMVTRSQ